MNLDDLHALTDTRGQFVLLEFCADWCPCRLAALGDLQSVASEYRTNLVVEHVDVTCCPEAGEVFLIDTIPTVLLYRDGELIQRWDNPITPEDVLQNLQQAISEWAVYESCQE